MDYLFDTKHEAAMKSLMIQATIPDPNTRSGASAYITPAERRLAERDIEEDIAQKMASQILREEERAEAVPALGTWEAFRVCGTQQAIAIAHEAPPPIVEPNEEYAAWKADPHAIVSRAALFTHGSIA
jgi:hypothetical protein